MKIKQLENLLKGDGSMPSQGITALKQYGFIQNSSNESGATSLDLVLEEECYEIENLILPTKGQTVRSLFKHMRARPHKGTTFKKGKQYLILQMELFHLPGELYCFTNPKSTTGRLFMHSRIVGDNISMYDHIPRNWESELWSHVCPKPFSVSYIPGKDSVNQVRLFTKDTRLSETELRSLQLSCSIVKDHTRKAIRNTDLITSGGDHGSVTLPIDCKGVNGSVGFIAIKNNTNPVPLSGVACCSADEYFKPVKPSEFLKLVPDEYYILSTGHLLSVPPQYASELKPIDPRFGEIRIHFAGYFDPGFGYDSKNPLAGNTATLEVVVHETTYLRHGQPIADFQFERMIEEPDVVYAQTKASFAHQVGAKLPRQFV